MLNPSKVCSVLRELVKDGHSTSIAYETAYHPNHAESVTDKVRVAAHTNSGECFIGSGRTEAEAVADLLTGKTIGDIYERVAGLRELLIRQNHFDEWIVTATTPLGTVESSPFNDMAEALDDAAQVAFNTLYGAR